MRISDWSSYVCSSDLDKKLINQRGRDMRIKASSKTVSMSAATVAVAICAQAPAQDAGRASSSRGLTDDEIIVTARKMNETVTDVRAKITVVTAADLESRRIGSGVDTDGHVHETGRRVG